MKVVASVMEWFAAGGVCSKGQLNGQLISTKQLKQVFVFFLGTYLIFTTFTPHTAIADVPADPSDPAYLAQTMECQFTPELIALTEKLEHDPVKIYNWVYKNIKYESYYYSRKGAHTTYMTKRGNSWDQSTLLIALLRIAGIPARYAVHEPTEIKVYVEAYIPYNDYRGSGSHGDNWIPLAPWVKDERENKDAIDLFSDGTVPTELSFDPLSYMLEMRKETPVEIFYKNLREYVAANYPGKTINDIPLHKEIIDKPSSILPNTLPKKEELSLVTDAYTETPEYARSHVTLIYKRVSDGSEIFRYKAYFAEVVGKRFYLTWEKTDGGNFKPTLMLDDTVLYQVGSRYPNDTISIWAEGTGFDEAKKFKSGVDYPGGFISMSLLPEAVSQENILKYIKQIQDIDVTQVNSSSTLRTRYQSLIGQLAAEGYHLRYRRNADKTNDIFHASSYFFKNGCVFAYSPPIETQELEIDNNNKFSYIAQINMDHASHGFSPHSSTKDWEYESPLYILYWDFFGYSSSMSEGMIFEDLLDTPGLNTLRVGMIANQNNIEVREFTSADLDASGNLPILENVTVNRYSDHHINGFKQILEEGRTFIAPISKVSYFDQLAVGWVWIDFPEEFFEEKEELIFNFAGWRFGLDHGGGNIEQAMIDQYFTITFDYVLGSTSDMFGDTTTGAISYPWAAENPEMNVWIQLGDPVNITTGEFFADETPDFMIKGRGFDLSVARRYRNRLDYNGPFGYGWTFEHDHKLIFNADSNVLYFDNKGDVRLIEHDNGVYSPPVGARFTFRKEGASYLLDQFDNITLTFSEDGLLTSKKDLHGNTLSYTYDGTFLTEVVDSSNRKLTFTPNANNKIDRITDDSGRYCVYGYDGDDLISVTDLEGNTTYYEYYKNQDKPANNHNMKKYTNAEGDSLSIFYYKNDKVSQHINDKGETFFFDYSTYNNYAETYNERGYYRKVFYNEVGDVIRVDDETNNLISFEYDPNHRNLIKKVDANGTTTYFDYGPTPEQRNVRSKRVVVTENGTTRDETWYYDYDPNCQLLSLQTDPKGNKTKYDYDPSTCFLTTKTEAFEHPTDQRITTYQPDGFGNLHKIIYQDTTEEVITYDSDGLYVDNKTDRLDNVTIYTHDDSGNVETVTEPSGVVTKRIHNNYNQKIEEIKDFHETEPTALNVTSQWQYNKIRQLKKTIDPNGGIIEHIYDIARDMVAGAKVIETIDPLGNREKYEYDEVGNRIKRIDRNGNITTYAYDGLNRLVEETDPFQNSTRYSYDSNGNVTAKIDKLDNTTTITYDEANRKIMEQDPEGVTIRYEYYKNGKLKNQIRVDGSDEIITSFEYDGLNRLKTKTVGYGAVDERGQSVARIFTYEYDIYDRPTRTTFPGGHYQVTTYDQDPQTSSYYSELLAFYPQLEAVNATLKIDSIFNNDNIKLTETVQVHDQRGLLVGQLDGNGNFHEFTYDTIGRKTHQYNPRANSDDPREDFIKYDYDAISNLVQIADQAGNITTHTYDLNNRRTTTTNALGYKQYFTYDNNGNLTSSSDDQGLLARTYYDALNRKIGLENALGATTTIDYDPNSNIVQQTSPLGNITRYQYDAANRLTKEINAENIETSRDYDAFGRLFKEQAGEQSTTISYNIFDEKISVADQLDNTTQYQYDQAGRMTMVTDPKGVSSAMTYDALGRIKSQTLAYGTPRHTTTHFDYDNNGNKISQTNAHDIVTRYTYNSRNLLTDEEKGFGLPDSLNTHYDYDATGKLEKLTDPRDNFIEYFYDALGRKISETGLARSSTAWRHDIRGNVIQETRPNGDQTFFEYDAANHLIRKTINGDSLAYQYDLEGRLIKELNYNSIATLYEYDALNRLHAKTEAAGTIDQAATTYEYDDYGNLTSLTGANHETVTYEYDTANRRTKEIDSDGKSVSLSYDTNGNIISKRKRDGTLISYTYDELNRQTKIEVGSSVEQIFAYDLLSRLVKAVDHNQGYQTHVTEFGYDRFNRLTEEIQDGLTVIKGYDASSNQTLTIYPTGKHINRVYTPDNQLDLVIDGRLDIPDSPQVQIADYHYDENRRVDQLLLANGIELGLNYDQQNREKTRNYTLNTATIYSMATDYDPQGNVLKETVTDEQSQGQIQQYSYDNLERLIFEQRIGFENTWKYDAVGNRTETTSTGSDVDGNAPLDAPDMKVYLYDWAERLISVRDQGVIISQYSYDAQNRRITKTKNPDIQPLPVSYVYDGSQVIEEYENGSFTRYFAYGLYVDDPLTMVTDSEERYYYLKDRIYSITALTDSTGSVVESYSYSAFGEIKMFDAIGSPISISQYGNSYGFTGRRLDTETGLWYYRNRMYSSVLGRFLQRDPAGYVDGFNLYVYVNNNPLRYLDPEGLQLRDAFGLGDFPSYVDPLGWDQDSFGEEALLAQNFNNGLTFDNSWHQRTDQQEFDEIIRLIESQDSNQSSSNIMVAWLNDVETSPFSQDDIYINSGYSVNSRPTMLADSNILAYYKYLGKSVSEYDRYGDRTVIDAYEHFLRIEGLPELINPQREIVSEQDTYIGLLVDLVTTSGPKVVNRIGKFFGKDIDIVLPSISIKKATQREYLQVPYVKSISNYSYQETPDGDIFNLKTSTSFGKKPIYINEYYKEREVYTVNSNPVYPIIEKWSGEWKSIR